MHTLVATRRHGRASAPSTLRGLRQTRRQVGRGEGMAARLCRPWAALPLGVGGGQCRGPGDGARVRHREIMRPRVQIGRACDRQCVSRVFASGTVSRGQVLPRGGRALGRVRARILAGAGEDGLQHVRGDGGGRCLTRPTWGGKSKKKKTQRFMWNVKSNQINKTKTKQRNTCTQKRARGGREPGSGCGSGSRASN